MTNEETEAAMQINSCDLFLKSPLRPEGKFLPLLRTLFDLLSSPGRPLLISVRPGDNTRHETRVRKTQQQKHPRFMLANYSYLQTATLAQGSLYSEE